MNYLNDYLGAKQDLNNVLNNFPNLLEETYHYLAFVKYNLGDFNDAIIDLNHVIEKQSKNAQLYIERAYFKLDKHDYKDAIEDCNKAINFNCLNENAYLCIGIAENEGKNGLCKIIINEEFSQVAGVHMIGSACSEMIYGASLMIEHELRVNDITDIVFPHPTVSEIIRDTMFTFNHQQPV